MRILRPALALGVVAALLGGLVLALPGESDFRIANRSDARIGDVTVSDGQRTWRLGDAAPGTSLHFRGHLTGEGGPMIAWTTGSQRYSGQGCYYTGGMPIRRAELAVAATALTVVRC